MKRGFLAALAIVVVAWAVYALWPPRVSLDSGSTPSHTPLLQGTPRAAATHLATTAGHELPDASEAPAVAPSLASPLSWARMSRRDFGCMLERESGHRDRLWSCETPEESSETPCADAENYFRGPQIPAEISASISSLVESVDLHWEHRELQEIDLRMKPGTDDRAIEAAFGLPGTLRAPAFPNVHGIEITDCGGGARCVVVRGFERGDLDCGDSRRPD